MTRRIPTHLGQRGELMIGQAHGGECVFCPTAESLAGPLVRALVNTARMLDQAITEAGSRLAAEAEDFLREGNER